MASGQTLAVFTPLHSEPPATAFSLLSTRNAHPILRYDASVSPSPYTHFTGVLPRNYSGNGITVTIIWCAQSATSGDTRWTVFFERLQDGTTDIDFDSFASGKSINSTAPGTNGAVKYASISFSNSEIDGLLAGEGFRIAVERTSSHANDTMTGDAQLLIVELKET